MKDERVSYLTLIVRSFGVTRGLVISGAARIEVSIALSTFWIVLHLKFGTIIRTKLD